MLLINLHFSSTIQRSCMTATNCSSCGDVVSVFVILQYCLCVATKAFRVFRGASRLLSTMCASQT